MCIISLLSPEWPPVLMIVRVFHSSSHIVTLAWWSLDDRFKTQLDYGISLSKTTASSVRESCCRAPMAPRYILQVDRTKKKVLLFYIN